MYINLPVMAGLQPLSFLFFFASNWITSVKGVHQNKWIRQMMFYIFEFN